MSGFCWLVATASGGEDIHLSVRAGSIPARIFSPKARPDSSTVCVVLTPAMIGNNVYPMGIGSNLKTILVQILTVVGCQSRLGGPLLTTWRISEDTDCSIPSYQNKHLLPSSSTNDHSLSLMTYFNHNDRIEGLGIQLRDTF